MQYVTNPKVNRKIHQNYFWGLLIRLFEHQSLIVAVCVMIRLCPSYYILLFFPPPLSVLFVLSLRLCVVYLGLLLPVTYFLPISLKATPAAHPLIKPQ